MKALILAIMLGLTSQSALAHDRDFPGSYSEWQRENRYTYNYSRDRHEYRRRDDDSKAVIGFIGGVLTTIVVSEIVKEKEQKVEPRKEPEKVKVCTVEKFYDKDGKLIRTKETCTEDYK